MAKIRLPPIGFWSYTRRDDELSRRRLSELKTLIEAELQAQLGQKVHIFQDVSTISHGARWEEETRRALNESSFFIPVLTPSFLQSRWCCKEVRIFLERQQQLFDTYPDLPRTSRIFPIHYIDVQEADAADEAILEQLKELQWFDFHEMRHLGCDPPDVRRSVSRFANSVCKLLRLRVEGVEPVTPSPEPRLAAFATHDSPVAPKAWTVDSAEAEEPPIPPAVAEGASGNSRIIATVAVAFAALMVLVLVVVIAGENRSSDDIYTNYAATDLGTDTNSMLAADMDNTVDMNMTDMNAMTDTGMETDMNTAVEVSASPPLPAATRRLLIENDCSQQVSLRVLYFANGAWQEGSGGSWEFAAGEHSLLRSGSNHIRSESSEFLMYAVSSDGRIWDGPHSRMFGGRSYPMRQVNAEVNADGNYVINLTCP